MAFAGSSNFVVQNLNAMDGTASAEVAFQRLVKEACLGAGHRSKERFDPPKCHPETRKAVLDDIMSWVDSTVSKEHILWMSGPAGAGKSSIAQTICDRCHGESKLLASFFFSRTAAETGRDDGNKFVPAIACQLAAAIPESKSFIVKALDDPAVLSYSMDVQMKKLVLEPLSQVYASVDCQSSSNNICLPLPYLVVIDGLDECNGSEMQSEIIRMIAAIFSDMHIHPALRVLVASRPELEIRNTFDFKFVSEICAPRIVLDENYGPDDDIRVYLESEFASLKREHTLKLILLEDSNWPTPDNIKMLVERSSGQFIYAATIIKYLKHPRRDPRDVLKSIIIYGSNAKDNNALFNESPFLQLDALYMQVLKTAVSNLQNQKDSFILVFQILSYEIDFEWLTPLDRMSSFMSMDRTKLRLLLSDLHSVISIPEDSEDRIEDIKFYHASFEDFLRDSSRSGEFYIAKEESHRALAHCCFTKLSEHQHHNELTMAEEYSARYYLSHIKYSGFNNTLLKELYNTPKLQAILFLILGEESDHLMYGDSYGWEELGAFFCFHRFEIPAITIKSENKQIKALCDRIADCIDELIIPSDSSVNDTDGTLVNAVASFYFYDQFEREYSSYKYSWLLWMLQTPERGKHRYLDSKESMRLYTKFCRTSEYKRYIKTYRTRTLRPFVLQYLLRRIEPSTDIDLDAFREMSKELTNDEAGCLVEEFLQSVDEFIQKCVGLKQNSLKRKLSLTAIEEQPSKLSRIDRIG